jgi:hypothetical protein
LQVLQTYQDASVVWDNVIQWQYRSALKESDAFRIICKYQLPWRDDPRTDRINAEDTHIWLACIWSAAADRLNQGASKPPARAMVSSTWGGVH